MDWHSEGNSWPHRGNSRFVEAGGLNWHVQEFGMPDREKFLLVHGTGASTHSFRHLAPLLARSFHVIACDLPGHGFTVAGRDADLSLPGMAGLLSGLIRRLSIEPAFAAGHSAGAAILLEMTASRLIAPSHLFGINAALQPIRGNAILSPLARIAARNPLTAQFLSLQARFTPAAGMLLRATRSPIDNAGRACYEALFRDPGHVAGALGMMANWDLEPLARRFAEIRVPVTLLAARDDDMVPAFVSKQAAQALPRGEYLEFPSGGHLLHEVQAGEVAASITGRCSADKEAAESVEVQANAPATKLA